MLVIVLHARLDPYTHDGHGEGEASGEERRGRAKGEGGRAEQREEKSSTRAGLSWAALLPPGCWVALSLLLGLNKY